MTEPKPSQPPLLPPELATRFEQIIDRLHAGENLDLHEKDLSTIFEAIATNLLSSHPAI